MKIIPTLAQLLEATSIESGIMLSDICGRQRMPAIVWARRFFVAASRSVEDVMGEPRYSYPEIARRIGRENHSTVLTCMRGFEREAGDRHREMVARIVARAHALRRAEFSTLASEPELMRAHGVTAAMVDAALLDSAAWQPARIRGAA